MIPLFILDPRFCNNEKDVGVNRLQFLLESLSDLNKYLTNNMNLRLCIAKGTPGDVFKMLYKKYTVKLVTFEAE